LDLEARLDYEAWSELTQAALIAARLQQWDLALDLAARSIRYLHWMGTRPLLAAMFNIVARVLTPISVARAAVIQGAATTFAATTSAPPPQLPPPSPSTAAGAPHPGATSFVTDLRRETTGLLIDALGEPRLHELRAQGQAMSTDDAVAYALDAVTRARRS